MAFVSQELKAKLAPTIKAILKKYKVKASIAVRNHSTLVLNIKSAPIDFITNYNTVAGPRTPATSDLRVNEYYYKDHFTGKALAFLSEVIPAMNDGNFDKSDIQTDYFCVGWYTDISIGQWNKPFVVTAK